MAGKDQSRAPLNVIFRTVLITAPSIDRPGFTKELKKRIDFMDYRFLNLKSVCF